MLESVAFESGRRLDDESRIELLRHERDPETRQLLRFPWIAFVAGEIAQEVISSSLSAHSLIKSALKFDESHITGSHKSIYDRT